MKTNNWIVLGISLLLSFIFFGLYFYLGFNLVDWPTGLLLSIVWWVSILGVGLALHFGSRNESARRKSSADVAGTALTLILVPTLICAIAVPTAYGASDESTKSGSSSDAAASAQSASSAISAKDSATSSTSGTGDKVTSTSEDLFYYKLDSQSAGVQLYYSVEDSELQLLEPGASFSCPRNDRVEFFVKPVEGYQTDMTFLHSGNASNYITPDTKGLYNRIGSGALQGFTNAVDEAISLGCLEEFHYSTNWDQFRYRQMLITAKPVAITVTYNLDGGAIDGKDAYTDGMVYYDSNVSNHPDSNIITLPATAPLKNGNTFEGWQLSTDTHLYKPGSTLNVDDFWKYIQQNATDQKIVFPMNAVWKKVTSTESSNAAPAPDTDSSSSSDSASKPGITTESTTGEGGSSSGSADAGSGGNGSDTSVDADKGSGSSSGESSGVSSGSSSSSTDSDINAGANSNSSVSSSSSSSENNSAVASTEKSSGSIKQYESSSAVSKHAAITDPTKDFAQVMPGTVKSDSFAAGPLSQVSGTLMVVAYSVTDAVGIGGPAQWNGIAYANRGCWVCYYMAAGIVLTLMYGAGVAIYRRSKSHKQQ